VADPERDSAFAGLVSLACHDLRTPLATVLGFVRTLPRVVDLDERAARYVELMDAAGTQLGELLDDLSLVARIEGGRFDPALREGDSLELARAAAARVAEGTVAVTGRGGAVAVEPDVVVRSLGHLARCAVRHGGLERVELEVDGPRIALAPVAPDVAAIALGQELRDFGAAVAVSAIAALGGATAAEEGRLVVRLPFEPVVS
jgi:signal transduction histidine kinase